MQFLIVVSTLWTALMQFIYISPKTIDLQFNQRGSIKMGSNTKNLEFLFQVKF